jgi:hypothetical protein
MSHKSAILSTREQHFVASLQHNSPCVEYVERHNFQSQQQIASFRNRDIENSQTEVSQASEQPIALSTTTRQLPPAASRRLPPRSALKVVPPKCSVHFSTLSSVSNNFRLQQKRARQLLVHLLQGKMKELIRLDTRHAFHLPGWNGECNTVDKFENTPENEDNWTQKSTHEIAYLSSRQEILSLADLSRLLYHVHSVSEFKDAFRLMIKRALQRVRRPWQTEWSYLEEYLIKGLGIFRDSYYIDQNVAPWLCARDFSSVNLCKNPIETCKICSSSLNSSRALICNLCHDMYHMLCVPCFHSEFPSQETFFCRNCEVLLQNQQFRQILRVQQASEMTSQQTRTLRVKWPRAIDIDRYFYSALPHREVTSPLTLSTTAPLPPYTALPTYEVDRIIGRRLYNKVLQYKVKWKNGNAPSWIFYIYMYDCDDLITDFEQKYADLIRLKHEEQLTKPLLENASSKEQKEKN